MTGSLAEEMTKNRPCTDVAAVLQDAGGKYKKALIAEPRATEPVPRFFMP
jgi:hypothetical protein